MPAVESKSANGSETSVAFDVVKESSNAAAAAGASIGVVTGAAAGVLLGPFLGPALGAFIGYGLGKYTGTQLATRELNANSEAAIHDK